MSVRLITEREEDTPKRVFIVGQYKKPFIEMFLSRTGYCGTLNLADADICLFTGGPDVDPQLYGQKKHKTTYLSEQRDTEDLDAYINSEHCLRVGVCRGAQFLNVMNGGSLWQDVNNHRAPHFMVDLQTGQNLWVTSTHHQMMIPGETAYRVAVCHCADRKETDTKIWTKDSAKKRDPEADDWEVLWYEESSSLCFQPHPENISATEELKQYFFQKLWTAHRLHKKRLEKAA